MTDMLRHFLAALALCATFLAVPAVGRAESPAGSEATPAPVLSAETKAARARLDAAKIELDQKEAALGGRDLSDAELGTLAAREHEDDLPRTISKVTELLEDIIQRQIVADVPLCSLLSGGLDSSAVTAMGHRAMAAQHGGRIRSFSVDFADHGAAFVPGEFHKSSDTPFVRDFVRHVGSDHTEVVLDSRELADQDLSRAVMRALDFPFSVTGDIFSSLYRLFQAVRAESTVALSGESADEIFGGYTWFHDPKAVEAATFPWIAAIGRSIDGRQVLDPALLEQLNLAEFEADSYTRAIAETPVHKGEDAYERAKAHVVATICGGLAA